MQTSTDNIITRRVHVALNLDGIEQKAFYDVSTGNSVGDYDEAVRLFRRYLWKRVVRTAKPTTSYEVIVDRIEAISNAQAWCVTSEIAAMREP